MKPVCIFIVIMAFFLSGNVKVQSDTSVIYLDSNMRVVPVGKAFYGEAIVHQNKMYLTALVDLKTKSTVYTGSYKDKNLSMPEGLFEYFTDKIRIMRGYYHNGKQVGTWKKWDKEGLLVDSVGFDNNGGVLAEAKYSYHTNKTLWRLVVEDDQDQKTSKEFDSSGILVSQGKFTSGDGETFIYYPNGKIKMHSLFQNNSRTLFEFFDEAGKKYNQQEYEDYIKAKP